METSLQFLGLSDMLPQHTIRALTYMSHVAYICMNMYQGVFFNAALPRCRMAAPTHYVRTDIYESCHIFVWIFIGGIFWCCITAVQNGCTPSGSPTCIPSTHLTHRHTQWEEGGGGVRMTGTAMSQIRSR